MVAQIDRKFIQARPWKAWSRLIAYLLFEGRPLTTRGRWINPLVFGLYRLWALLPFRPPVQPVFILGMGRSGTTVLGKILGMHRNVGYLNEPKALWQAALGDDDLLGSYSARQGRYCMDCKDATQEKTCRLNRYYGAFLRLSCSRRVVDKYPELLFRNGLLDQVFPSAKKILLVRNGADVCRSIKEWSADHRDKNTDWWGLNDRKWHLLVQELVTPDPWFASALCTIKTLTGQQDRAAIEWIVTMRATRRVQASAPQGLLVVHYEDLVAHPSAVMAKICDYCELPQDEVVLSYACEILHSRPSHPHPRLHPDIQTLFDETMQDFGYAPARAA